MGGDGGSIPTRRCLVKQKERKARENPHAKRASQNGYCQLSAQKLRKPIIASRQGKLYNKEAVMNHLVDHRGKPLKPGEVDKLPEIKSLKTDAFEVQLGDNQNYKRTEDDVQEVTNSFPFMCSVTGYEMNGAQKFCFGLNTKHVVSEKALKQANMKFLPKLIVDESISLHYIYQPKYEDQLLCPVTNLPFGRPIQLYPESELEVQRAKSWLSVRKQKRKKDKHKNGDASASKQVKIDQVRTTSIIKLPSVLKMTNEVVKEGENSREIEVYRELKLIGDTTKSEDKSALGQMFKCSRPWQH